MPRQIIDVDSPYSGTRGSAGVDLRYPAGGPRLLVEEGQMAVNRTVPTQETTAGNVTYTAAEFIAGLIDRDPNGSARSDVTPTAALLVAAIDNVAVGDILDIFISNAGAATEDITMTGGTGVTVVGDATIGDGTVVHMLLQFTNVTSGAEAATLWMVSGTST